MKDTYDYIAVFTLEESGLYGVEVPNFGEVYSQGENLEDAIFNITECLELGIYGREKDNEPLPIPIDPLEYKNKLEPNQFMMNIHAIMPRARKAINNKSVKKTLTIPQWLNEEVMKYDINLSKLLQDAIMKELNIK
ncbi:type II toxin-antitoxin system HicB family antitoxin [Clostridioides difficile]|nr:type II toxin-antitoxin system HicB family antitoxin [Clostridioides difficile]MBZ0632409.1 type II toxin-antitoxin system HicB family antitoxin [Clostridioides difficile]MBZ0658267.1 type II toxin-antitoxin system HicB family antitoxin [Clostridioides difficile]HBF9262888.1 type II toxin-antitoxin system HicB family antitoxin [Clostridioides difficile]HBF9360011.1 type II toxin-antitoxin system HicB family antitoxin [Clostridioides difficile]